MPTHLHYRVAAQFGGRLRAAPVRGWACASGGDIGRIQSIGNRGLRYLERPQRQRVLSRFFAVGFAGAAMGFDQCTEIALGRASEKWCSGDRNEGWQQIVYSSHTCRAFAKSTTHG